MESKLLIDVHYDGDAQVVVKYNFNEEDVRDKLVGRLIWRHTAEKRGFAIVEIFDDRSDGSCQACIRPLSYEQLGHFIPEILMQLKKDYDRAHIALTINPDDSAPAVYPAEKTIKTNEVHPILLPILDMITDSLPK